MSTDGTDRRGFLRGTALAASGVALGSLGVSRAVAAETKATPEPDQSIAFQGVHQAGVLQQRQPAVAFLACDITSRSRAELVDLMQTLTDRARFLTAGGVPPNLGISAPPSDSGLLGPTVLPGNLTVTVGLGASAFDDRYGLAAAKPLRLRPMDTFPNDELDRAQCDGDLLLQVAGDDRDVVVHAIRDLTRHTRGGLALRWRLDGVTAPSRPDGAPRNYLGFKDGTANPAVTDAASMNELVWVQPGSGEPAWATGGSYHVVRIIRMLVEFWDRVTISEQERMIGRRRDDGAPLTGDVEADIPDYSNDPSGDEIPLDAHIRVANPRTPATDTQRILRRGYNYDRGTDSNGNLDMGLIFSCFQQDLDRQFVTIQKRLVDEPLVDYISPVGGGYFFTLPGVQTASDYFGRDLLS